MISESFSAAMTDKAFIFVNRKIYIYIKKLFSDFLDLDNKKCGFCLQSIMKLLDCKDDLKLYYTTI